MGFMENGNWCIPISYIVIFIYIYIYIFVKQHGAPPAAKDVVETLPKVKITQSDVDASAECPVCKDLFVVDDESHKLPCAHSFHIDCILPWLKQVSVLLATLNSLDCLLV